MAASVTADPSDIVVPQGPFGGPHGRAFYDGVGDIVQITVTYSDLVVYSVQTAYQQGAAKFMTRRHRTSGPSTFKNTLDFPTEYLVQVKGTIGPASHLTTDVVTSLTFVTNKTTHGPFGAMVGRQFQSSPYGKEMGFYGRSSTFVDSIGIFTDFSYPYDNLSAEGPWGVDEGDVFYDGRADKIMAIDVEHNDAIISLNVKYAHGNQGFSSAKHGGTGTVKGVVEKIEFESDEFLVQVTGTHGKAHFTLPMVTSLTLISNKRSYGPYGDASGTRFQTPPNAHVLGFYGHCGWMVHQLGAFVSTPSLSVLADEAWGGNGGSAFYNGRGEIGQITVVYTDEFICRLQVTYLQGGESFEAPTHGTAKGQTLVVKLKTGEYVVQVRGTHGRGSYMADCIRSLQFITNKTSYGPYGNTGEEPHLLRPQRNVLWDSSDALGFFSTSWVPS